MVSSTSTSLTLRALLEEAARRAGLSARRRSTSGLSPSAAAFFAAVTTSDSRTILVVPTEGILEQMLSDIRFFLSCLEDLSTDDLERQVIPFPSHEVDPYRGLTPHLDVVATRARALHAMALGNARVVVTSVAALLPRVSPPERLLAASIKLEKGENFPLTRLVDLLIDAGFTREDPVDQHGEFSVRGGLVDFFPADDHSPTRIEFVDDAIESIRHYDPTTQLSTTPLDRTEVVAIREVFEDQISKGKIASANGIGSSSFFDYLGRGCQERILSFEPEEIKSQGKKIVARIQVSHNEALQHGESVSPLEQLLVDWSEVEQWLGTATQLTQLGVDDIRGNVSEHESDRIPCQSVREFRGRLSDWVADVRQNHERAEKVLFVAATPGRAERLSELLSEYELSAISIDETEDKDAAAVLLVTGQLSRGFRLPTAALQIYAESDLFDEKNRTREKPRSPVGSFLSDFRDLKTGDFVVHVEHGIGVFVALREIDLSGESQEFMELRYAGKDKLFVPVEHLDSVQKYTGGAKPSLDRLGGTSWERTKTRLRRAMRDMAGELLRLYAARKSMSGHSFGPDSHWQREFEDAFEYELTSDQQVVIADIKKDMESPVPMDRLLCGDVGYGKTEVAMRATFKAVMDGKQVAWLAPTTVLVFQHLKTIVDRVVAFPVRVEMLSRFRTRAEQSRILIDLADGKIDIIIGTHRLLSKDVRFKDFGLLIVDEEQRFGVWHKERIKQLRRQVDVLTMTATPIPRTLNMSLAGIRDMSVIETAPKDRLAIQTNVITFDESVIARAIRTELERGGQVYFVHDRVESISSIAGLLRRLVPEARIGVAHGQSSEAALERCMVDFIRHKCDILLATTIIENGLDIPNANTIVINHAERYGLAQLYQLRGRVGRSNRRAYAHLVVPPTPLLSAIARKRLAAIKEFSDLGSGFRVAALDLEIRGAGNLLGAEQSGHINAVGFDMYIKLLEQTVNELKGQEIQERARAVINLKVDLRIEEKYISDTNQRLSLYRRVAAARSESDLDQILEEMGDRYGPMPSSLLSLVEYGRIRLVADKLGVEALDREGHSLVLKFGPESRIDPASLIRFAQKNSGVTLTPPAVLRINLRQPIASKTEKSWWTVKTVWNEEESDFRRKAIVKHESRDSLSIERIFTFVTGLFTELSKDTEVN